MAACLPLGVRVCPSSQAIAQSVAQKRVAPTQPLSPAVRSALTTCTSGGLRRTGLSSGRVSASLPAENFGYVWHLRRSNGLLSHAEWRRPARGRAAGAARASSERDENLRRWERGLPPRRRSAWPWEKSWEENLQAARQSQPVTKAIIAANLLLFALVNYHPRGRSLLLWGVKVAPLIRAGQYWRLLTPAFLHRDVWHLLVNMNSLLSIGGQVESTFGGVQLLVVYAVAAVAGNALSCFGSPRSLSLGASGAVFGLVGAELVFALRLRGAVAAKGRHWTVANSFLKSLVQTVVLNLILGSMLRFIDGYAHVGGLIGGAFAALLVAPSFWRSPEGQVYRLP